MCPSLKGPCSDLGLFGEPGFLTHWWGALGKSAGTVLTWRQLWVLPRPSWQSLAGETRSRSLITVVQVPLVLTCRKHRVRDKH